MRLERREGYWLLIGGPVPRGAAAITFGRLVSVRKAHAGSRSLLYHERVHVRQWRRYGLLGFSSRYLGSYVLWRLRGKGHQGAYLRIPFEIEADWVARRALATEVREPGADEPSVVEQPRRIV
jgi:hypothetical protein